MDLSIRSAIVHDYHELCALMEGVDALHREQLPWMFREPRGPVRERDYVYGLLADEDTALIVAESGGALVGFVLVMVRETPPFPIMVPRRFAVVDTLAVHENYRRTGIGAALMEAAHAWAREKKAKGVELTVYSFNQGAIDFYQSLGYETFSQRMRLKL